jgi:hypothetical protein
LLERLSGPGRPNYQHSRRSRWRQAGIHAAWQHPPRGHSAKRPASRFNDSLISLADVIFKSAEELRRCQTEVAQQARRRHERAQADVAAAASPTELLNVQAELLRYDLESAGEYWQRLMVICTAAQAEAVDLMSKSAAGLGRAAAPAATAAPVMPHLAATPGSHDGLDPSQAWNRWVDLGKQWNDMLYRTEAALH